MKNWYWLLIILSVFLAAFLRLYRLPYNPVSLYWEEAALGYDAYSILNTGRDFHGNSWPTVAFESFGDWKPSGYFYATALSEFFLSLNELAVRLPSALAGIGIVLIGILMAKEFFDKDKKYSSWIVIATGVVIAISPWALQFSRAGFEANLAAFFSCLGILFLFKGQKKGFYFLPAVISLVISLYSYHSVRLFIPLLCLAYLIVFWKRIIKQWSWVLISGIVGAVLIMPIVLKIGDPELTHRFQETSAFTEVMPIIEINQLREAEGNTLLSRIIHHRYWHNGGIFLKNFTSHFNPNYLFIHGDGNLRHSTGQMGIFYPIDSIFLLLGLAFIVRKPTKKTIFLILWWLLALVPASLTKAIPHSLRTLLALPAPQMIVAYGLIKAFPSFNKSLSSWLRNGLMIVVLGSLVLFSWRYLYDYFGHYSYRSSCDWQDGYKEMVKYVFENRNKYDKIFITRQLGRPSIYYFFYNQIDPQIVQADEEKADKDQGERLSFENIVFGSPGLIKKKNNQRFLLVSGEKEEFEGQLLKEIQNQKGEIVFKIKEL